MYLDIPAEGNLDDELSRNLIHGYYASVSYLDALIGDLIQGLDDLGLRENTTIVLWSDHGYFLGEHGMWCKHSTFYEAVKIPLMISTPNYAKNEITESFTELVDIYPTLCEIANIEAPTYLQGESLTPVLKDPTTMLKTEIYTRYKEGEAVIDKDFSYTEFYRGKEYLGNMMYDLHKDLKQNLDISKMPENAELVEKYSEKLKAMRMKVDQKPF
jgi:arylsulfatase A-like enzyme